MRRAIVACVVLAPVVARAGNEDSFLFGDQAVLSMTGPYTSTFFERLVDARASRFGAEALAGVQIDAGGGWHLGATARSPRYVFREYASTDNSTVLVSTGDVHDQELSIYIGSGLEF